MQEYLTCKSGKFYLSSKYDREKINLLLAKVNNLNETVADLPVLPDMASRLETQLIRQSIFGTAAIEGNPLSQEEVSEIIGDVSREKITQKSEIEIRNLIDAYDFLAQIEPQKEHFRLTEDLIKILHRIVTTDVWHEFNEPGLYRNNINSRTEVGDRQHGGIYKSPKTLKDIRDLMRLYVEWINSDELINADPLIRAALAHYHFSLIHPFFDGNGRTARLIEAIILQTENIKYVPKMLSNFYYRNIDEYYLAFSLTIKKKGTDVTPFLEFCLKGAVESLTSMKKEIIFLIKRLVFRELLAQRKNDKKITQRQFDLLSLLLDFPQEISLKDITEKVPFSTLYRGVSKQTTRRDLKKLLEENLLYETDGGKYFLNFDVL